MANLYARFPYIVDGALDLATNPSSLHPHRDSVEMSHSNFAELAFCDIGEYGQCAYGEASEHFRFQRRIHQLLGDDQLVDLGCGSGARLTPLGEALRSDVPDSAWSFVLFFTAPWFERGRNTEWR